MEDIRAKYSLGEEISVIEEDFHNAIYDLENTGSREIGYLKSNLDDFLRNFVRNG